MSPNRTRTRMIALIRLGSFVCGAARTTNFPEHLSKASGNVGLPSDATPNDAFKRTARRDCGVC